MWKDIRSSAVLLVVLTAITGLAYPAVVAALARIAFPAQAEGSLIEKDGRVVGSALIGQSFTRAEYFWGRPSATTSPYDAANSGASNLGPSAKALDEQVAGRKQALLAANPDEAASIPADLLTSSASGLDPHITPAGASWQVKRVAMARRAAMEEVRTLVAEFTEGRELGVLGEPRVNVLKLNLALDERWPMK